MTLTQIAMNNLRRRLGKMLFVLLGLMIGVATVVAVFSVVEAMKLEMTRQMDEYGANIVITADTGEVTFSYGGITIPEVLFDVEKLSTDDFAALADLPSRHMIRAMVPKLLGMSEAGGKQVIVAGSDLQSEFAVKPWLRLQSEDTADTPAKNMDKNAGKGDMDVIKLDLARENLEKLQLTDTDAVVGAIAAHRLGLDAGDTFALAGRQFTVAGVLEENGSPEDMQIMMDLGKAQELLGLPGEVTLIEIAADYSLGSEDMILRQLREALPHARVASLRQAVLGRDGMLTRLTRFGASVSVLVLAVGMLVVALTMSAAVRERTREIGIFRALGFRKSHITRIILLEGVMVSVLGGLCGYTAGILLARTAGPLLAGMETAAIWRVDLLAAAVLLAVFIGLSASLVPMRQAAQLDPAEALRFI